MTRPVLLIDISAGPLPVITPVSRPPGSWSQAVYTPPAEIPPVDAITAPVVDGILIEWESIGVANATYVVERAAGPTGPWVEIARTTALRYTYTGATEQEWYFRVRAVVNGRSGLGGVAAGRARSVPGMQEIEDAIKQGELGQQLTSTIGKVDLNSETIIQQALEQYDLADESRASRAYIARVEETSVTVEQARAMVQETVGAEVAGLAATVQETKQAMASIDGRLSASYTLKAQAAINGRYYMAGVTAGVYADGETVQTEVLFLANRLGLLSTTSDGTVYTPFVVDNGVVRISQAMIGDGSINNAMIGSYIQSDNFLWDMQAGIYRGWRIDKNGSARFAGDVEVRGTVYAAALVGEFQRSTLVQWIGPITAAPSQTTGTWTLAAPIKYGESHVPSLQLQVACRNTAGDPCNGILNIQRQNSDGSWATIKSRNCYIRSAADDVFTFLVLDTRTTASRSYRVQTADAGNRSGSFVVDSVTGQLVGIR